MSLIEYTTGKHKVPSKAVQLPATLDGFTSLKDGSINIRFNTQEVTGEQLAILKDYLNTFGWVLFKPSETAFIDSDIPSYDPESHDEKKSPSERMRSVLYLVWKQLHTDKNWDSWYRQEYEKLINHYKQKLPPV